MPSCVRFFVGSVFGSATGGATAGSVADAGSGSGSGVGAAVGVGSGVGTGTGAATGSSVGAGVGTGIGAATGSSVGAGVGTGTGAATGSGVGAGVGAGTGSLEFCFGNEFKIESTSISFIFEAAPTGACPEFVVVVAAVGAVTAVPSGLDSSFFGSRSYAAFCSSSNSVRVIKIRCVFTLAPKAVANASIKRKSGLFNA